MSGQGRERHFERTPAVSALPPIATERCIMRLHPAEFGLFVAIVSRPETAERCRLRSLTHLTRQRIAKARAAGSPRASRGIGGNTALGPGQVATLRNAPERL